MKTYADAQMLPRLSYSTSISLRSTCLYIGTYSNTIIMNYINLSNTLLQCAVHYTLRATAAAVQHQM